MGRPEIENCITRRRQVADRPMRIGSPRAVRRQPLERNRQIGTSFRRRQGVNFVDDDVLDAAPDRPPGFLAQ